MIIVEVMGGLGNQLQQYALYRKMKYLGKEAKLDISWFTDEKRQKNVAAGRKLELNFFENLPMEICTAQEKERLVGRDNLAGKLKRKLMPGTDKRFLESGIYHPEIFDLEDACLSGFWACEKYYADILPCLRKEIIFPQTLAEAGEQGAFDRIVPEKCQKIQNCQNNQNNKNNYKNKQIIQRMKEELSVSIHIRRGDYLDPVNAAMFGGICTEEYYDAAIRYVLERYPQAHFYLFSDDSSYVREKYQGERYTVVDWNRGEDSFYDMQLMSCCSHNICANSTFSFWGARLNPNPDKIMIRPAKHKNSQPVEPDKLHDWWKGWTIIDEKGRIL